MNIKLNNEYKIVSEDELNITLYRKTDKSKAPKHIKIVDKNKDNWKVIGHFINMEHLADEIVEREIKLLEAKSFKELLVTVKDLKNALLHRK